MDGIARKSAIISCQSRVISALTAVRDEGFLRDEESLGAASPDDEDLGQGSLGRLGRPILDPGLQLLARVFAQEGPSLPVPELDDILDGVQVRRLAEEQRQRLEGRFPFLLALRLVLEMVVEHVDDEGGLEGRGVVGHGIALARQILAYRRRKVGPE